MAPKVLDSVVAKIAAQIEGSIGVAVDSGLRSEMLRSIERTRERLSAEPDAKMVALVESPWPYPAMVQAVSEMTWQIASGPSRRDSLSFVTSDNPAFFFESLGLGQPSSELTVPPSSTLALLGSHQAGQPGIQHVTATPGLVKEVNRRLIAGAERFVYCARREPWIETVAAQPRPYLSRIDWTG